jgi:predicted enzyme related to lactoylglutathione lyase
MNGLAYFEIPSNDLEKAKLFYSELFGWKCEYSPEGKYMMFSTPDGPAGGFGKDMETHTKGINIYIEVEDLETTISKAIEIGGKCLTPKTEISPEYGFYAFIEDLEGNKIGLWGKQ